MTQPRSLLDDLDIKEVAPDFRDAVDERAEQRRMNGKPPAKAAPGRAKPAPPYKEGMFIEPLAQLYGLLALGLMPFKENSALALAESAVTCAEAWDGWAAQSPAVRRMLAPLLNAEGFGKVAIAHAPVMFAVVGDVAPRYAATMAKLGEKLANVFTRQATAQ